MIQHKILVLVVCNPNLLIKRPELHSCMIAEGKNAKFNRKNLNDNYQQKTTPS